MAGKIQPPPPPCLMSSALHLSSAPRLPSADHLRSSASQREFRWRTSDFRRYGKNPTSPGGDGGSQPENAVLKLAWYGSEILGIAASFLRPASGREREQERELPEDDWSGAVGRAQVVEAIKEDFQRSYFVTGNLTLNAYQEDCEFADPAGSFRGLRRFKRNCSNFGSLLVKANMKLTKWEDFEDKGVGHWRFSCVMSFPWRPILSATGYTEYYFDAHSGRVCRHVEHWNVPKMALLKQIFRPTRWVWGKSAQSS